MLDAHPPEALQHGWFLAPQELWLWHYHTHGKSHFTPLPKMAHTCPATFGQLALQH